MSNKLNNSTTNKLNKLITKRFVIRKSLIGTNTIITFTSKKGKQITYQHSVDNTECLYRVRKHSCIARCIATAPLAQHRYEHYKIIYM